MCLIVVQPKGVAGMPEDEFRDAWRGNHDGAGLMFVRNGKLEFWKPFWKLRHFWKAYEDAQELATGHVVLHFRLATGGKLDELNTHPHILLDGEVGMAHNGILDAYTDPNRSDTVIWAQEVFSKVPPDALLSERMRQEFEPQIGWNKIVFLGQEDRLQIWNEDMGHWVEGRWYSNSSVLLPWLEPRTSYAGRSKWSQVAWWNDYDREDEDYEFLRKM
jgi:hypothetical protein